MQIAPLILCLLLAFAGITPAVAADATPSKPNIIIIFVDDLGIGNLSCYGGDKFKTPNIDKLAASGIRFEHCYSSPLCGPSRALLLTGRYGFRTGMTNNDTGNLMKPANEIMIPTVLRQAGYITGQCGKWNQMPLEPSDWGFQEYMRFQGSGKYWSTQKAARTYTVNGKEVPLQSGQYLPDKMNDFVDDFLTRHKDQPFFLYYPMSHIHTPILRTPDSAPGRSGNELYQDNVAYMDKLVGKLVDTLDRLKLREKTLIIFAGDNGTAPGFKEFVTVNGKQLSGCKNTMLECGALVPMIVSWPGTTPPNQVSENLINTVDYFPTLAELAGAKMPPGVTIDGHPFTPMLHGQNTGDWLRDWIFVLLRREWYDRDQHWKLNQAGQLFDMKNAPFEETLVPADTKDNDALAAREHLQAILTQLNPAGGYVYQGTETDGESFKNVKRDRKNGKTGAPKNDADMENGPDE